DLVLLLFPYLMERNGLDPPPTAVSMRLDTLRLANVVAITRTQQLKQFAPGLQRHVSANAQKDRRLQVNGVPIEICVVPAGHQRVDLNGVSCHELGAKSLH